VIASLPALLASLNPRRDLSVVELVACGLWVVGFAGETTADRQRLRFITNPANIGQRCRTGLWRYGHRPDRLFEGIVWVAFAIFGLTALR
jgi:steroid 5-alpha reductase family enzyme